MRMIYTCAVGNLTDTLKQPSRPTHFLEDSNYSVADYTQAQLSRYSSLSMPQRAEIVISDVAKYRTPEGRAISERYERLRNQITELYARASFIPGQEPNDPDTRRMMRDSYIAAKEAQKQLGNITKEYEPIKDRIRANPRAYGVPLLPRASASSPVRYSAIPEDMLENRNVEKAKLRIAEGERIAKESELRLQRIAEETAAQGVTAVPTVEAVPVPASASAEPAKTNPLTLAAIGFGVLKLLALI